MCSWTVTPSLCTITSVWSEGMSVAHSIFLLVLEQCTFPWGSHFYTLRCVWWEHLSCPHQHYLCHRAGYRDRWPIEDYFLVPGNWFCDRHIAWQGNRCKSNKGRNPTRGEKKNEKLRQSSALSHEDQPCFFFFKSSLKYISFVDDGAITIQKWCLSQETMIFQVCSHQALDES